MEFTGKELAAVLRFGITMVAADGRNDASEMDVIKNELMRFGASAGQMIALTNEARKMDPDEAIRIISGFDDERKKYVASYLAIIMIADGNIDDKELALWQMASLLCGLPEMDIQQAVDNMNNI